MEQNMNTAVTPEVMLSWLQGKWDLIKPVWLGTDQTTTEETILQQLGIGPDEQEKIHCYRTCKQRYISLHRYRETYLDNPEEQDYLCDYCFFNNVLL